MSRNGNQIPAIALQILRGSPRSFLRVARRARCGKSMVSMVATGKRTSERIRRALIREAARLAKLQGYAVALKIMEAMEAAKDAPRR